MKKAKKQLNIGQKDVFDEVVPSGLNDTDKEMKIKKTRTVKKNKEYNRGKKENTEPKKKDGALKAEPEDSQKEKKSWIYLFWSLIIIAVIVLAIFLIPKLIHFNQGSEDVYTYNMFKFQKLPDGTWYTESQEGQNLLQIRLRYGARDLENISVYGKITDFRKYNTVYVVFDPTAEYFANLSMASSEIQTKFRQHYGMTLLGGWTKPSPKYPNVTVDIVTCASKKDNDSVGVVFLNQKSPPQVIIDGNCATIQGEGSDIVRAADRFMLGYYGIM